VDHVAKLATPRHVVVGVEVLGLIGKSAFRVLEVDFDGVEDWDRDPGEAGKILVDGEEDGSTKVGGRSVLKVLEGLTQNIVPSVLVDALASARTVHDVLVHLAEEFALAPASCAEKSRMLVFGGVVHFHPDLWKKQDTMLTPNGRSTVCCSRDNTLLHL
jgi:hypothetical protein